MAELFCSGKFGLHAVETCLPIMLENFAELSKQKQAQEVIDEPSPQPSGMARTIVETFCSAHVSKREYVGI